MTRELSIGLVQGGSASSVASENRERLADQARQALAAGADLVVLPELGVPGYVMDRQYQSGAAEPLDGPTVAEWQTLAASRDAIIVGGFAERDGDDLFNSVVAVNRDGVVLHYRKLHLFDAEQDIFEPGDLGLPILDTGTVKIGVCVCYDLRFVEVVRLLALKGAEVICVPTAWVGGFDDQLWDAEGFCPQARGAAFQANLSQTFIACASQAGDAHGQRFLGSSLLVDPWGKVLAGPLSPDSDECRTAQIDLDDVERAKRRGRLRPRAERRTDVYGLFHEGQSY